MEQNHSSAALSKGHRQSSKIRLFAAAEITKTFQAAISLSGSDRAELIDRLATLDQEQRQAINAAWAEEAERRLTALDQGDVQTMKGSASCALWRAESGREFSFPATGESKMFADFACSFINVLAVFNVGNKSHILVVVDLIHNSKIAHAKSP